MMLMAPELTLLESMPAVSLAELQHEADFQIRHDRKYLISPDLLDHFLDSLGAGVRVLDIDGRRRFTYVTPYFDDANHTAYLLAAHRRPNRFKVRTRWYVDSGARQLEVKLRDAKGRTVKHRIEHQEETLVDLGAQERRWIGGFQQIGSCSGGLHHCLTTEYERSTLLLPNRTGRVTIDSSLRFMDPDGSQCAIQELITIETKGNGKPTCADRLLWRLGQRPVSVSKFATGISLLNPELPANRWNRTLQRVEHCAVFEPAR